MTVGDLQVGQIIKTKEGKSAKVKNLLNTGEIVTTYNFEVKDINTYYVSAAMVLVHNCGGKTKTDKLKNHILNGELDAARREAAGEVVARKADGTPWDHVTELEDAQNGLLNRINSINKQLSSTKGLSDTTRSGLLKELSEASKLLDKTEGFLPRK